MKLNITINGKTYEVEVEDAEEVALEHSASVLSAVQSAVLPTAAAGAFSDFDESKVCRSPLAGVVSRLHVQASEDVVANQLLLLLEAMKMEIKITAQEAGKIKTIEVAPGDAVRPGQILVYFH